MNVKRWLRGHSLKLLAIRDTPEAIAGGLAIGIFFGFTPLFGLKTILAIFFAWLTRSNIIAAVIAGTLHDLVLPIMPVIFIWEYDIGFRVLNHHWPHGIPVRLALHEWRDWSRMLSSHVGKPMLLGSVFIATPLATACYFISKTLVTKYRLKHPHAPVSEDEEVEP
jgi:uncharacterized protein (DUF2062 family)